MKHFFLFLLLWLPLAVQAQQESEELPAPPKEGTNAAMPINIQVGQAQYRGQSISHVIMPTFHKYPPLEFKSGKEKERYNRLVANVKKLLPLAKLARITIVETHDYLQTLPDAKAREAHIREVERGLMKQYKPTVSHLSRSQGRLLVKLIDRECNQTGLQIARAFIGAFQANLYQGIAFFFGLNLNKRYDPEGDDRLTERVVRMVESGQL